MKNLGLKLVILTSSLYIFLFFILNFNLTDFSLLKLNEKGDFLAGAFSPLAFLWLVYGYIQQGKELKQNTKALKLQYQELSNSVEQQKILSEITKNELDIIIQKDIREKNSETISAQPFFHISDLKILNTDYSNGYIILAGILKNSRAICRELNIVSTSRAGNTKISIKFDYLESNTEYGRKFEMFIPYGWELSMNDKCSIDLEFNYFDAYDREQTQLITISISKNYNPDVNENFDFEIKRNNNKFN